MFDYLPEIVDSLRSLESFTNAMHSFLIARVTSKRVKYFFLDIFNLSRILFCGVNFSYQLTIFHLKPTIKPMTKRGYSFCVWLVLSGLRWVSVMLQFIVSNALNNVPYGSTHSVSINTVFEVRFPKKNCSFSLHVIA